MSRAITSLAAVKAVWETYRRDYIENFVPFVATLIMRKRFTEIDYSKLDGFLKDFQDEFGLAIPYHPMITILERSKKRGLFEKRLHKLVPIEKAIQKYDFSDLTIKKEAEINKVLAEFATFCLSKHNFKVETAETEKAFNAFFRHHDLDILFASQTKSLLAEGRTSKQLKFLINAFINEAKNNNPQIFDYILNISTGHILASTILYEKNLSCFSGKMKKIEIYLDVKFIFRLLGAEGVEYEKSYLSLILSFLEQGAGLFIFKHTLDEIFIILRNCLKWINSADYDPLKASDILRYFYDNGKNESDIHQYIGTLEDRLKTFKIAVQEAPDFNNNTEYQVDELKLREKIIEIYKANPYFDEFTKLSTIDRDVKTISSVYRLRKNFCPQSIQQSGYIFLTTNTGLAYAVKKFEDGYCEAKFHIPGCITDVFMGTLVWMQSPIKWVGLNKNKLVADCVSALRPDEQFIKKVVDEATKLKERGTVSEDEFLAVSRSYFIQEMLIADTLGDPGLVTSDSLIQIINKIKTEAALIPEQQLKQAKAKMQELEGRLSAYEQSDNLRKFKLEMRAQKIAKFTSNAIFIGLFTLYIISVLVTFSNNIFLTIILTLLFGIPTTVCGFDLIGVKKKINEMLSKKILKFLEKRLIG